MIKQMWEFMNAKYGWDEEGATAVEYGIMVAAIAAVIIAIVIVLGGQVNQAFTDVSGSMGQLQGGT
jgi:pilus assembly protein Flp/PilA